MNWTAIILIIVVCQLVPGISTVPVEPRWNLRQETIQRGMSKLKSIHNSCSPFIFRRSYRSCSQLSEKSCSKSTGTVPLQSNNTLANYIFYQILRFYGCWMNQMCMRLIQANTDLVDTEEVPVHSEEVPVHAEEVPDPAFEPHGFFFFFLDF